MMTRCRRSGDIYIYIKVRVDFFSYYKSTVRLGIVLRRNMYTLLSITPILGSKNELVVVVVIVVVVLVVVVVGSDSG